MIALQLNELDLMEAWQAGSGMRCDVAFPLMGAQGGSMGAVYFELKAGQTLGSHIDSEDEIVIVLSGEGEGIVGDKLSPVSAGGLVSIPAMTPHGFRNTGSETLRAVGIFSEAGVITTFESEILPMGVRVLDHADLPGRPPN